jgi:hypothetical protein
MIFDGGNGDMQLGGDFGVRKPLDEESQDLPFSIYDLARGFCCICVYTESTQKMI